MLDDHTDAPWLRFLDGADVDPGRVELAVEELGFPGGELVHLPAPGVTAVVGANNSGKSSFLRQLNQRLRRPGSPAGESFDLLPHQKVGRTGSGEDMVAWLGQHASYQEPNPGVAGSFSRPQAGPLLLDHARTNWPNEWDLNGPVSSFLVWFADAANRLHAAGGVQQREDVAAAATHPLHLLQDDAGLMRRLDALSWRILRQRLTLDDLSGSMRLRVGRPDVEAPSRGDSQGRYRHAMARLPGLEDQGDGMKSLLGLLLPLVTATYPVILVDEPEAFLHPPQAGALGAVLGELAVEQGVQVILATHDRNLLAGLLSSETPLSVVRLTRSGDTTRAAQLGSEQLRELWNDPVLRYSNVLDGLFHQLVVLGESDGDCRFYAAALDAVDEARNLPIPPSDVLFVPANGKAGMARLAEALRAVDVPVVASPDLDVLNDQAVLSRLVAALGGTWADMAADHSSVTQQLQQPRSEALVADVHRTVADVLGKVVDADPAARYTPNLRRRVTTALRSYESPWRMVKQVGTRAFTGEAAAALDRLLGKLEGVGVVPVRVGELESFDLSLGPSNKADWLPAALTAGVHRKPEPQNHVARLVAAARQNS